MTDDFGSFVLSTALQYDCFHAMATELLFFGLGGSQPYPRLIVFIEQA